MVRSVASEGESCTRDRERDEGELARNGLFEVGVLKQCRNPAFVVADVVFGEWGWWGGFFGLFAVGCHGEGIDVVRNRTI